MNRWSNRFFALLVAASLIAASCSVPNDAVTMHENADAAPAVEVTLHMPDPRPAGDAATWDAIVLGRLERAEVLGEVDPGLFAGLAGELCSGLATMPYAKAQLGNYPSATSELEQLSLDDCDLMVTDIEPSPSTAATWDDVVAERYELTVGFLSHEAFAEAAVNLCESGLPADLDDRSRYSWSEAEHLTGISQHGDCGLLAGTERAPTSGNTAASSGNAVLASTSDDTAAFIAQPPSDAATWDAVVLAKYNEFEPTGIFIEEFAIAANGLCLGVMSTDQLERLFSGSEILIDLLIDLSENDCDSFASGIVSGSNLPTGATTWGEMLDLRYAQAVAFRDRSAFEGLADRVCAEGPGFLSFEVTPSESVHQQLRAMHTNSECELPKAAPGDTAPQAGGVGEWIMFTSTRDGDQEIYVVRPDGTDVRQVTDNDYFDGRLSWSLDGSQIGYTVDPIDNTPSEVKIMNADGSGQLQLSDNREVDGRPFVSHDGQWVAWEHGTSTGSVVVQEIASGDRTTVSSSVTSMSLGFMDLTNRWSPDGSLILIDGRDELDNSTDVHVVPAAGGVPTQLTFGLGADSPAWSPDGTKIAFAGDGEGDNGDDIFVMDADGSNIDRLTSLAASSSGPKWSPDGQLIAFRSRSELGMGELYIVDPATGEVQVLTSSGRGEVFWHEWSPDSKRLVYTHDDPATWLFGDESDPETAMYTVDLDGNESALAQNGRPVAWRDLGTDTGAPGIEATQPTAPSTTGDDATATDGVADQVASAATGQIVYSEQEPGTADEERSREVFSLDVATGTSTQLTSSGDFKDNIVLSPDGDEITYISPEPGYAQGWLYAMNLDGSRLRLIEDLDGYTDAGFISADGNDMFMVNSGWGYLAPFTGTRLIFGPDATATRYNHGSGNVWSPDGSMIAIDYPSELGVLSVSNGAVTVLVDDAGDPIDAVEFFWAPDSSHLIFSERYPVESEDGTSWHLRLAAVDASGENYRVVVSAQGDNFHGPRYSPDGRHMVFAGWVDRENGLWIANADGTNVRSLVDFDRYAPESFFWSPDGSSIVFTNEDQMQLVTIDGQITDLKVQGFAAGWTSG